jgi:MSHA biogenesis protein MshO
MTSGSIPDRDAIRRGFTLVEAVMVIVLTGIIAAVVAVFIVRPIQGYFDTVRRSQLSNVAEFALRRIARDIQTALPNSIRSIDPYFLEFLPLRAAGRYCASSDCGDALNTTAADTAFAVLGPCVEIQTNDNIVIYNTGQAGANAYATGSVDNRSTFSAGASDTAGCSGSNFYSKAGFASFQFPRDSSSFRFQVISAPVTYACESATGTLWRFSGYSIQSGQPITWSGSNLVTGSGNITGQSLATNVVCASDASNIGTGFEVQNGDGLVLLRIQLRDSGETLSLYREVHIDNAP